MRSERDAVFGAACGVNVRPPAASTAPSAWFSVLTAVAVKTPFGDGKAIFFRDPDGYIVEAVQIPPPADAPVAPKSAEARLATV